MYKRWQSATRNGRTPIVKQELQGSFSKPSKGVTAELDALLPSILGKTYK